MRWAFFGRGLVLAAVLAPAGGVRANDRINQFVNQGKETANSANQTVQQGKSTVDQAGRTIKGTGQQTKEQANKAVTETQDQAHKAGSTTKQKANEETDKTIEKGKKLIEDLK
jgi:gas vesicle protein